MSRTPARYAARRGGRQANEQLNGVGLKSWRERRGQNIEPAPRRRWGRA
jgi:hypothetical protein